VDVPVEPVAVRRKLVVVPTETEAEPDDPKDPATPLIVTDVVFSVVHDKVDEPGPASTEGVAVKDVTFERSAVKFATVAVEVALWHPPAVSTAVSVVCPAPPTVKVIDDVP
jgi:hypothetical protein